MLVRIDPLERAVGKQALDKHGMMYGLSLTTTKRRMVRVVSPSQRGLGLVLAFLLEKCCHRSLRFQYQSYTA